MNRLTITLTLALVLAGAGLTPAAGQNLCAPPASRPGFTDYTIDLATGAPVGAPSYKLSDQVRFLFLNRNPFLEYDIQVNEKDVPEPALTSFVSLFTISALVSTSTSQSPTPSTATATATATPSSRATEMIGAFLDSPDVVDPCESDVKAVRQEIKLISNELQILRNTAETLRTEVEDVQRDFTQRQTIFEAKGATCNTLVTNMNSHLQLVTNAALRSDFSAYEREFNALLGTSGRISDLDRLIGTAQRSCRGNPFADLLPLMRDAFVTAEKIDEIRAQKQQIANALQAVDSNASKLQTILSRPESFYVEKFSGPFENLRLVQVRVRSKKPSDKTFPETFEISRDVRFGSRQRFTLSVGASFTDIETREYEVTQGVQLNEMGDVVRDANGNDTITRVIGLKEDSSTRITPLILLNTRLWQPDGIGSTGKIGFSGIHFALGLSGKVDNKGTDVEYLGGFSFSFAEDRLFITLAAYNGRIQELQDGFFVGKPLPESVAQAPVRKDRSWGPAVAITYRLN